jgi:hypothetical protein
MPNSAGLPNPQSYGVTTGAEPTVCDRVTGLMWQQIPTGAYVSRSWVNALMYCADLRWAGYEDWHFPTRIELVSILDLSQTDPAIDPTAFPGTPAENFWSITTDPILVNLGVMIDFSAGYLGFDDTTANHLVRCVR